MNSFIYTGSTFSPQKQRIHDLVSRKRHQGGKSNLRFGKKTAIDGPNGKNYVLVKVFARKKGNNHPALSIIKLLRTLKVVAYHNPNGTKQIHQT
jgi:hypothetical protein